MQHIPNNKRYFSYFFAVVVVVFGAVKLNHLSLPYVWDELGVYAQGAVYQFQHGISLMPASLDTEISRGHPLLLTTLSATAMKLFGCTPFVAHSFQLFIAVILLCCVYYYTSIFYNKLTGLVAATILAFQPVFVSQSILVLPEVTLALLLFLAMVNYVNHRYGYFALFCSLAILTKESAVVLPATMLTYALLRRLFTRHNYEAFTLKNLLLTVTPFFVFGVFLVVQKIQNGWFFFPYHLDNTGLSITDTLTKFKDFTVFLFNDQGRYWWIAILIAGPIAAALRGGISTALLKKGIAMPAVLFMISFLAFSSLSFYMERYVLVVLILLTILTAAALVSALKHKLPVAIATLLLVYVALVRYASNDYWRNDTDMGYIKHIQTLQQAINYCAKATRGNDYVFSNFPGYFAINFMESGYINKPELIRGCTAMTDSLKYIIITKPGAWVKFEDKYKPTEVAYFKDGYAEARVYQVTPKQKD